jgi:hypothetical protein
MKIPTEIRSLKGSNPKLGTNLGCILNRTLNRTPVLGAS